MLPITWTYSATKFDVGPAKNFVRALLVLPICASTVVLLIQDSLALAFGLAALVAAVRFRVSLSDTIDGIYICRDLRRPGRRNWLPRCGGHHGPVLLHDQRRYVVHEFWQKPD